MFGIQLSAAAAQILVRVAIVAAVVAAGFGLGVAYEERGATPPPLSWVLGQGPRYALIQLQLANQRAAARAQVVVARQEARAEGVTARTDAATTQSQAQIRVVTRTIHDQVPVFIPAAADSSRLLTTGFVRLHDAAALGDPGQVSGPPAPADDAPSASPPSVVLGTIVDNYGTCRADQDRLAKLQQWIRDQQAVADAPVTPQ